MQFPEYRIVYNSAKHTINIKSGYDYSKSLHLYGETADRMYQLLTGKTAAPLSDAERELTGKINELSLLKPTGEINGSIREIDCEHHLRLVQIETLLACNLKCPYCYCAAGKQRKEHLDFDRIEHLLDDCERLGVLTIDYTGGEFFLRRDWKELIVAARSRGMAVNLHTNGMALTKANVELMRQAGVDHVQVSADGHTPELHNSVRGHPKSFQRMIKSIRLMKRNGIHVRVALMVHKANIDKFEEIFNFYRGLGVEIVVDQIASFGSELNAKMGVSPKEYYEATIPFFRRNKWSEPVAHTKQCGRVIGWRPDDYEPPCGIGYSYVFITSIGEIAICPQLTSREDPVEFGGPNLADISLYEAWTESEFFERHRHISCANVETCPAGTVCRGGCRADAYSQSKNARAPELFECNKFKNHTDKYVDFTERYAAGDFTLVEEETATPETS